MTLLLWLDSRGGLHDARITAVRSMPDQRLEIAVDDEWANERGLARPLTEKDPCILSFENVSILEGSWEGKVGGWISEIEALEDGSIRFAFCDRPEVIIRGSPIGPA